MRLVALLLMVWAGIFAARALPTEQTLSGPSWIIPGVIADFDFIHQRYWQSGQISSPTQLFVFSRNVNAWIDNTAGVWTLFPPGAMRVSDKGMLSELLAVNQLLWNRDMTNVAWTASNVTTAQTADGVDGIANSATTLTATAGNGTVLQAVTLGSAAYVYSVFIRRRTGTGNVDITVDGGTTWTTKTLTSTYQRFQVTKTAANPSSGIRIVTSGDAIDVDFNQTEAGLQASSPFKTTTVANTRSADVLSWRTAIPISSQTGVVYVEWQQPALGTPVASDVFQIRVDSNNSYVGGSNATAKGFLSSTSGGVGAFAATSTNSMVNNGIYRMALSYAVSNYAAAFSASLNTAAITQASGATIIGDATGFGIGASAPGTVQCNCYMRRLAYGTVNVQTATIMNWAQAQ